MLFFSPSGPAGRGLAPFLAALAALAHALTPTELSLIPEITSPPIRATLSSLLTAPSSPLLVSSLTPFSTPLSSSSLAPYSKPSPTTIRTASTAPKSRDDDDDADDGTRPPAHAADSSLSTGAAAGIGIGSTAGGVLLLVLVGWVVHRRKRPGTRRGSDVEAAADGVGREQSGAGAGAGGSHKTEEAPERMMEPGLGQGAGGDARAEMRV